MKIIHSFTMRVLMIMVSLLLLFCAVSTIAWYRSFTQEAVETAEEHMDTVIETLNEMFDEKTKYFTEDSDIDIAWFTNSPIDLVLRGKFERFLEKVLGLKVDLVVVNKDSSPYLLCNIFEYGEIIFEYGENFSNWFDKFYDETLVDRELYFMYMEDKNRYVQY